MSPHQLRENHARCEPTCIVQRCGVRRCTVACPSASTVIFNCDTCVAFPHAETHPDFVVFGGDESQGRHVWLIIEIEGTTRRPARYCRATSSWGRRSPKSCPLPCRRSRRCRTGSGRNSSTAAVTQRTSTGLAVSPSNRPAKAQGSALEMQAGANVCHAHFALTSPNLPHDAAFTGCVVGQVEDIQTTYFLANSGSHSRSAASSSSVIDRIWARVSTAP